jgi:hypothetical protein
MVIFVQRQSISSPIDYNSLWFLMQRKLAVSDQRPRVSSNPCDHIIFLAFYISLHVFSVTVNATAFTDLFD